MTKTDWRTRARSGCKMCLGTGKKIRGPFAHEDCSHEKEHQRTATLLEQVAEEAREDERTIGKLAVTVAITRTIKCAEEYERKGWEAGVADAVEDVTQCLSVSTTMRILPRLAALRERGPV